MSLSDRQWRLLQRLDKDWRGDYWPYLKTLATELEMPHRDVRNAARALARKGLARVEHLFDEATALTAGSTYIITAEGHQAVRDLLAAEASL